MGHYAHLYLGARKWPPTVFGGRSIKTARASQPRKRFQKLIRAVLDGHSLENNLQVMVPCSVFPKRIGRESVPAR